MEEKDTRLIIKKYTGGPHIYIITCDKCEVRFDGYKLSKEEIIKRWNTRV